MRTASRLSLSFPVAELFLIADEAVYENLSRDACMPAGRMAAAAGSASTWQLGCPGADPPLAPAGPLTHQLVPSTRFSSNYLRKTEQIRIFIGLGAVGHSTSDLL